MDPRFETSPLELRVIDTLSVWVSGKPIELAARLRWILARVVLDGGVARRTVLASTFWTKGATQSLRQALYALRALPDSDRWLDVTREQVTVYARCDALELFAKIDDGRFEEALPRGALRLFDDSNADKTPELSLWLQEQQERFDERIRRCLLGATRTYVARGELDRALVCVDRALARDVLDEPIAREGMRVCALRGDLRSALDRYEELRRSLLDKLGVEPTEETDALADELAKKLRESPRGSTLRWDDRPELARVFAPFEAGACVLVDGVIDGRDAGALRRGFIARAPDGFVADGAGNDQGAYTSAIRWLDALGAREALGGRLDAASPVRAPLAKTRARWQIASALRAALNKRAVFVDLRLVDVPSALSLLDALDGAAMLCVDALDQSLRASLDERSRVYVSLTGQSDSTSDFASIAAREIERCSVNARRLCQWLAIGESTGGADDAVISAVLELDAAAREAAFDELERKGWVVRRSLFDAGLCERVRSTVSESVAQGWHRRAAVVLDARGSADAATHWELAGDLARAVAGWIVRAKSFVLVCEYSSALAALDRADSHAASALQRFEIVSIREAIFAATGAREEREIALAAMNTCALMVQSDRALIEARLRRAAFDREGGHYGAVLAASAELESDCVRAGLDDCARRARAERAIALLRTGDTDRAALVFESLRADPDLASRCVGEYGLGAIAGYRLRLDEARARHERVLTEARAAGDFGLVARALNGLAATAERAGKRRRAAERFLESASLSRSVRDHEAARMAEVNAALAWVFGGRPGRALALLDASRDEDRALLRPLALEATARAELELETGGFSAARAHFDRCLALAEEGNDARRASHTRLERAFASRAWDECLAAAERELSGPHTSDVAALSWLELALVAPSKMLVETLLARAGADLGPVGSLLALLARLRLGDDPGPPLDRALDEAETMFALLGWRMLEVRRSHADTRFEAAFLDACEGLDEARSRRWRRWIELRAAREWGACWDNELRNL